MLRIGDMHVLAASVMAQVLMVAVALLGALGPIRVEELERRCRVAPMDLALAIFNIGAGLGVLAAGGALVYLAWQATPLIRESRAPDGRPAPADPRDRHASCVRSSRTPGS